MNDTEQEQSPDSMANKVSVDASSAEADLALIRKMMLQAQNSAAIDGRFLVLWGSVLGLTQAIVLFTASFMGNSENQWTIYIWFVMLGIGICGSIILAYMHSRSTVNTGVRTYASIWIGFCLTMCLLFILAISGQESLLFSLAIIAPAITGLAFFATAAIIGLGWLRWVAFCWWLTAIAIALLESSPFVGVIYMLSYIFLMAGPGLLIAQNGKRS